MSLLGPPSSVPRKRAILSLGPVVKLIKSSQITDSTSTNQPDTVTVVQENSETSNIDTITSPSQSSSSNHTAAASSIDSHAAAPSPPVASVPVSSSSHTSVASHKGLVIDPLRQSQIDAAFISAGLDVGLGAAGGPPDPRRCIECYDFPAQGKAYQLQQVLGPSALATHFVDDSTVIIIFDTELNAARAVRENESQFKFRTMEEAPEESRRQAQQIAVPVQSRPKTDSTAANRLLAGALGLRMPRQTPEQRAEEKQRNEERRRKAEQARKEAEKADAWD